MHCLQQVVVNFQLVNVHNVFNCCLFYDDHVNRRSDVYYNTASVGTAMPYASAICTTTPEEPSFENGGLNVVLGTRGSDACPSTAIGAPTTLVDDEATSSQTNRALGTLVSLVSMDEIDVVPIASVGD